MIAKFFYLGFLKGIEDGGRVEFSVLLIENRIVSAIKDNALPLDTVVVYKQSREKVQTTEFHL